MKGYLLLFALIGFCRGQTRLGSYNLESYMSVSGLSSGAYMANQFHVAQSSKMVGAAMFAGGPYYCAQGSMLTATNACMKLPSSINMNAIRTTTQNYANSRLIDPVSNMANDKVFIFSGSKDTVVVPGVTLKLEEYYQAYVTSPGAIKTVYDIPAQHGMPTDSYGGACGSTNLEYINNCNYNGAYEALNHIYGGLQKPSSSAGLSGQLILFDQSEFFKLAPASTYGMDTAGYIYIPTSCQAGEKCKLHIVFHGCLQGREKVGDKFARNAGYNQVADLNNFIIMYPQAKSNMSNINGCWDWWGFSSYAYANKNGYQMTGVERMMLRTLGQY
ncbi:poly(3-hydroxybutyrate) depolymerase-like [Rhinophrynus dorsalis]